MSYIADRRQEEKDRRRSEIVEAAESLYQELGWDAVTMDSVAKKARLSRALVYVYFKDKRELLLAITERAFMVLRARFEEARSRARTGLDQIEAMGRAYMAFGVEFNHYFDACARLEQRASETPEKGSIEEAVFQMGVRVHEVVVASLKAGQADGSVRADLGDLEVTSRVLWGFTHGLMQIAITKAGPLAQAGISVTQLTQQAIALIRYTLAGSGAGSGSSLTE
ncbi:MAG TPA: TetR/AcrR family transcriptional regulator [Steroidobacter sp.]|uniref:TetR/AcrR family transcriptional regulator n=1 Tax=Steroidobacter sp. TaxID=1978227 RepID=UPI002ED871BF